ncbi:MAG: FAD-dependent oxidoreductase, partial [Pseudomonadota bacterium]
IISMLAEVPDLWDLKSSDWTVETASARFAEQGAQEPWVRFAKPLTDRPIVGVGRFTSPDAMVSQIKRGVLDLIGAARPSIADPFLPKKIDEGREDEIRECIGCNICVSGYHDGVPARCTQNPTMGEEWRRKWHPERIPKAASPDNVLVVGAGPAGLECARALGQRGYAVTLAEARDELGGRVTIESQLPGLGSWSRVRDYRVHALQTMPNVDIYRGSSLSAQDVVDFGCDHAVIATGAGWSPQILDVEGYPRDLTGAPVLTPDDVLAGIKVAGPVIVYDFDHYTMGACLAELLTERDLDVTLVTPANAVSAWTFMNNESGRIRSRLMELGIDIELEKRVVGLVDGQVELAHAYANDQREYRECGALVVVGSRRPNDHLFGELAGNDNLSSIRAIGDCRAPGAIVHAVYSGHECARTIESDADGDSNAIAWETAQL